MFAATITLDGQTWQISLSDKDDISINLACEMSEPVVHSVPAIRTLIAVLQMAIYEVENS